MKTFLNVLYRRILYKIPLKLLLILLAVFGLLFACTKAENVTINTNFNNVFNGSKVINFDSNSYDILCINNINCNNMCYNFNHGGPNQSVCEPIKKMDTLGDNLGVCITGGFIDYYTEDNSCTVMVSEISNTNTIFTSQQCQSEYNLIPISEVDSSYCQSNNLCPSTPSDCPNIGVSNLFINDIFHPGAFNIIMNIPEEISWDYAYTNSGNNFNLDIEGYNVDYEKMQSVIDNQSYIPTEEDFQNIIAILTPYTKIIVFFVFLFIVWAWIKKPFKSKKL